MACQAGIPGDRAPVQIPNAEAPRRGHRRFSWPGRSCGPIGPGRRFLVWLDLSSAPAEPGYSQSRLSADGSAPLEPRVHADLRQEAEVPAVPFGLLAEGVLPFGHRTEARAGDPLPIMSWWNPSVKSARVWFGANRRGSFALRDSADTAVRCPPFVG